MPELSIIALVGIGMAVHVAPGPSNLLMLTIAARDGLRAGVPFLLGSSAAYGVLWGVCAAGAGGLVELDAQTAAVLKWTGFALVALIMLRTLAATRVEAGVPSRSAGAAAGFAMQFVNPSAWLSCLAITAIFAIEGGAGAPFHAFVPQWLVFALVGLPVALAATATWATAGALCGSFARRPAFAHALNAVAIVAISSTGYALAAA